MKISLKALTGFSGLGELLLRTMWYCCKDFTYISKLLKAFNKIYVGECFACTDGYQYLGT